MAEHETRTDPTDRTDRTDGSERPVVWLLVAAAAVALLTLGVVLRFGLLAPPELAAVDLDTRPEHALAILSYRGSERGQCLDVIGPDGQVREVRCMLDGIGPLLGWDERGILVLRFTSFGERLEIIDPVDGGVVTTESFDLREVDLQRWSTVVDVDRSGGTLTVRDEGREILWSVTAPDSYWITASARHPLTGDIAMLDAAGRLLVLRDGEDQPRVWVAGLAQRYGEIVWQGTPLLAE
jgi:hypothetical protein